jgi:hypothetical protein|tara:strand:- start:369 stop:665 length:297 start_codon:yes stop_codon:yes gene_type:complete
MISGNTMATIFTISLLCLFAMNASSELPLEIYEQLKQDELRKHTQLINTFSQNAILFDADRPQMLGTISTGIGANDFEVDLEKSIVHTAETYLSRHTK